MERKKTVDEKTVFFDTYSSRLVDILTLILIVILVIYLNIKIWGADSLLETTGIFGIVAAFLAFTSNIWAPDIISGLIVLNSQMLEDGDVVRLSDSEDEYVIAKVSFIYVILFDIRNNHKTLIRNAEFLKNKIENLSRIASTDGIRQKLVYKIGYPKINPIANEDKNEGAIRFLNKVDQLFNDVYNQCLSRDDILINKKRKFEWALTETGNYALEFTLWIFIERIPNTKVTSKIRRYLIGSSYKVNELVYRNSILYDLDLSTPNLSNISIAANNNEKTE